MIQVLTVLDRTGQDRTGQDRTGQTSAISYTIKEALLAEEGNEDKKKPDNCKSRKVMKKESVRDVIPRTRIAHLFTSSEECRLGGRRKAHVPYPLCSDRSARR
jgi:hypothetical protein